MPMQVPDFAHMYKVLTEALMEYNETSAGVAAQPALAWGLRAGRHHPSQPNYHACSVARG